jgi:hypothetical protein
MSWLPNWIIDKNESTIITKSADIDKFCKWYSTTLLKTNFKINSSIDIETLFHLLLFIMEDGDVCYFTNELSIKKNICNNKKNLSISKLFTTYINVHIPVFLNKSMSKEFITSLIKYVNQMYLTCVVQRKYLCDDGSILDNIIEKIKAIITDDSILDKSNSIKLLEDDFKLINDKIIDSNVDFEIIKHNYELFIGIMNKLNDNNKYIDNQVFTPMEIISSKKD